MRSSSHDVIDRQVASSASRPGPQGGTNHLLHLRCYGASCSTHEAVSISTSHVEVRPGACTPALSTECGDDTLHSAVHRLDPWWVHHPSMTILQNVGCVFSQSTVWRHLLPLNILFVCMFIRSNIKYQNILPAALARYGTGLALAAVANVLNGLQNASKTQP